MVQTQRHTSALVDRIRQSLIAASALLFSLENEEQSQAAHILGNHFIDFYSQLPEINSVTVEGFDTTVRDKTKALHVFVKPLDGSLYYQKKRFTNGMPYSGVVTIARRRNRFAIKFRNIVASGIIDYRNNDLWLAEKYGYTMNLIRTYVNDIADVKTCGEESVNLLKDVMIGEMYYPRNRWQMTSAFANEKGFLRSTGCTSMEMASVGSGEAAAFICGTQKNLELGAAALLVEGNGGVVVDWQGHSIMNRRYKLHGHTDVVLAANDSLAQDIVDRLHR
ncbi:MAG: hypothetical protein NVSMB66_1910 [Candidatus Doudnabacteria bacterium]